MTDASSTLPSLAELSRLSEAQFVTLLGGVVEHSPWAASAAWRRRPFRSLADLGAAFEVSIRDASQADQIALIRAHPELAGSEADADELTQDSSREQSSAGLDRMTAEEVAAVRRLNRSYRERFGFPLIVCVREHTKASIMAWGTARLAHTREQEIEVALGEIAKIARLRLEELVVARP